MSARFRRDKGIVYRIPHGNVEDDAMVNYARYDTSPGEAHDGTIGSPLFDPAGDAYPMQGERIHTEAAGASIGMVPAVNANDPAMAWQPLAAMAMSGRVNANPYTVGVVDSSLVDAHRMDGEQATIRRRTVDMRGPVGGDNNMLTTLSWLQQQTTYYPGIASQGDVNRSI